MNSFKRSVSLHLKTPASNWPCFSHNTSQYITMHRHTQQPSKITPGVSARLWQECWVGHSAVSAWPSHRIRAQLSLCFSLHSCLCGSWWRRYGRCWWPAFTTLFYDGLWKATVALFSPQLAPHHSLPFHLFPLPFFIWLACNHFLPIWCSHYFSLNKLQHITHYYRPTIVQALYPVDSA